MSEFQFDEIGYWSEVKLDILREYAAVYSRILASKKLEHLYIDAFAGAGVHKAKVSGALVAGSPSIALTISPPFREYHFIDLNESKVASLEALSGTRHDVHVHHGDCNKILLDEVFPRAKFEDYRRALCILDPYGLDLDWQVISAAGRMRSIELFVNFPVQDMNRNVLWRNPGRVSPAQARRMTTYWGDESWKTAAYKPASQQSLFGDAGEEKASNDQVAEAFRQRLQTAATFAHVPEPVAMRNSRNAIVYYLFFASHQPVASKIVTDIFDKYRRRQVQ